MNWQQYKNIHILGIKGAGISALAVWLKTKFPNLKIQGSDTSDTFFSDSILKQTQISVLPFKKSNITKKTEALIYSPAYPSIHPEREQAEKMGIPQFSYPEFLGAIFNSYFGIAVAGTHGKSTTSALLTHVLEQTNNDPNAIIGAEVLTWNSNMRVGNSDYFIIEADEYKESFLNYKPKLLIITNIDWDHPDHFPTREDYIKAFQKFISRMDAQGTIIARREDIPLLKSHTKAKLIIYEPIEVKSDYLRGPHNKANAGAVAAATKQFKINEEQAIVAMENFTGTRRRFEILIQTEKIAVMDDYAHHPREIEATLSAVKEKFPDRIVWALFQPHTFSRTVALIDDFAISFKNADCAWITDIYASAREIEGKINAQDLVARIKKSGGTAFYWPGVKPPEKLIETWDEVTPLVIVIMGAGDVFKIAHRLTKHLQKK